MTGLFPKPLALAGVAASAALLLAALPAVAGPLVLANLADPHHVLSAPICGSYRNPNGGAVQTFSGVVTATGPLTVNGGVLRTVNTPGIASYTIASTGLLCFTAGWSPTVPVSLSVLVTAGWAPPVHVEGVADLSRGCTVNVSGNLTRWPLRVIEADSLVGACSAGTIPSGFEVWTGGGVVELRRVSP